MTDRRRPSWRRLAGAVALVLLVDGLVLWASGIPAAAIVLPGAVAVGALANALRRPTSTGQASDRPPVETTAEAVGPLSWRLIASDVRYRSARLAALVLLVGSVALASVTHRFDHSAVPMLTVASLFALDRELPWLVWAFRLGRRPGARVPVRVVAVGRPSRGRVLLAGPTLTWSAVRSGVLADVVVGDVLVGDLDRRGGLVVLTLGMRSGSADDARWEPDTLVSQDERPVGQPAVKPISETATSLNREPG